MERTGRRALDDSQQDATRESPAPVAMPGLSNHAFAALVARDAKPKEKPAVTGPRVEFPDIGAVPIESMQWAGGSGRPTGREQDRPSEITFTSKVGDHSSDLMRQALQGKAQDVEVFFGGTKFKLKGAMVSSYNTGSGAEQEPMETWTLNFQSIELEGEKQEDKRPDWDRDGYPG